MLDIYSDPDLYEATSLWYMECVERAHSYPTGSFGYVFWWSIRFDMSRSNVIEEWAKRPGNAFREWVLYLEFKWDQLERHRAAHQIDAAGGATLRETGEKLNASELTLSTNGMVLLPDGRAVPFNDIDWNHEEAEPEP